MQEENKVKEEKVKETSKPEGKPTVTTEVTSIAKEEQNSGQKIDVPGPEELVNRASSSLLNNLKHLEPVFAKLSSRGKTRVMTAVLNLPMDGVPVHLQNDQEKLAFALGQRIIGDRFIITQHHINLQIREQKALEEALDKAEKEKAENTAEEKTENSKEKENE